MEMHTYRAILSLTSLCGCQGVSGGGWAHYVGQEKVRPLAGWTTVTVGSDWMGPPRLHNGTSFYYFALDSWRHELLSMDKLTPPDRKGSLPDHPADCNALAARLGWLPFYPQFKENSLETCEKAVKAGAVTDAEIVAHTLERLKSGDAHGYLVSTFLSERTNHRTDEFGGCFENRLRLPRLIVENIRRKTGGIMPILCRINASDELDGGQSVQDAAAVAAYLEQECGVDAIHVSRAVHLRDEFMWAPGQFHGGFSAPLVEEIKRAVTVPVIAVGRFTEPQYAELLVRQGRADLIAFGRQSIADPELPNRARDGQLETLAPCIGCLLGCVPNMLSGRPITCAVNPLVGRELEWGPAGQKKRVAVVGGGPGGLYAAWACARRGHQVVLLEQGEQLGGTLRIASFPTGKGQISAAVRSMIVRCQQAGVEIRTGTRATPELLRQLAPDAAILATGSGPLIPPIPGLDSCGFVTAQDMLEGRAVVGAGVLVVGGGMIGFEAAEFLGERGHRVAVVEMKEDIAADVRPEHRRCLLKNLRESQVLVRTGARVERFYPDGVDYVLADGTEGSLRGYDSVVLAMGTRSREELRERIAAFVPQVLVVGEAASAPGNAVRATGDALDAALSI